ncbi:MULTISPECIES: hypothetical protein [unclassified Amycolatopsis]|uniref:NucA/NucB deoxyribonuclease domain-containing protein n=1 Tax=unclassified Amycolatopsis TaxID=2618356 RepID=UPI001C69A073|nr:hypothetical protein [Amycolatopsis sp. DSM 110486]QYN20138.1 hypothetical protein K1T34_47600 [Amycolatopsis sp. DSM 110486]
MAGPVGNLVPRGKASPNNGVSQACLSDASNPDRFVSCSYEGWTVNHIHEVDGVDEVVGWIDLNIYSSIDFDQSRAASWELNAEIFVPDTEGTLQDGTTAQMWTGCMDHPDKCITSQLEGTDAENEPVQLAPQALINKTYTQYTDLPQAGQTTVLNGNLGVALEVAVPGASTTIADHESNTLVGRCDSLSNNYGQGCVDQNGPAYVEYNSIDNPKVTEVAKHVFTAIRTLPSHWGNPSLSHPLTRLTDGKKDDANRAFACAGVVVDPGVTSCDEYPLASTYQGGPASAANDRSTAVVPKAANDSQGGLTQGYYDYYRILDSDPFWVQAVLPDGTKVW